MQYLQSCNTFYSEEAQIVFSIVHPKYLSWDAKQVVVSLHQAVLSDGRYEVKTNSTEHAGGVWGAGDRLAWAMTGRRANIPQTCKRHLQAG